MNRKAPPQKMQTATCKRAACGLAVPPYHRAKPIKLPPNATGASRGRAPLQLLTGWVAPSRRSGYPEMTWGRALKKALICKGLPVNFKGWRAIAIAEDRSEWRSRTFTKPMPPSENWSYRIRGSKDEHCITQKDTQPSQTCSRGFIKTQLYATCCYFFAIGEYKV